MKTKLKPLSKRCVRVVIKSNLFICQKYEENLTFLGGQAITAIMVNKCGEHKDGANLRMKCVYKYVKNLVLETDRN